jgi:hypothetical protein
MADGPYCLADASNCMFDHSSAWQIPFFFTADATFLHGKYHSTAWPMPSYCMANAIFLQGRYYSTAW